MPVYLALHSEAPGSRSTCPERKREPEVEAGGGTAGGAVLEAGGIPPPKIRVNSPGAPPAGEDPGSEVIGDSAGGVARGLRNNRVNSPGCCFSDASGEGIAAAGVAMGGGSLGWL